MAVHYIPEGYRTVTPYLVIRGAAEAIDWYKRVFGAEEVVRMSMPDGKLMHGEIKIGGSFVMLGEECAGMSKSPKTLGGTPVGVHLYVPDCDAAFQQAVNAGAEAKMPPEDMFWGDRFSKITDPFGHEWTIATHKEDVTPDEMERRTAEAIKQMSAGLGAA
jgi:PhnB protein